MGPRNIQKPVKIRWCGWRILDSFSVIFWPPKIFLNFYLLGSLYVIFAVILNAINHYLMNIFVGPHLATKFQSKFGGSKTQQIDLKFDIPA